jgi:hypothetical protein
VRFLARGPTGELFRVVGRGSGFGQHALWASCENAMCFAIRLLATGFSNERSPPCQKFFQKKRKKTCRAAIHVSETARFAVSGRSAPNRTL